jgi:hypothetical protein
MDLGWGADSEAYCKRNECGKAESKVEGQYKGSLKIESGRPLRTIGQSRSSQGLHASRFCTSQSNDYGSEDFHSVVDTIED